MASKFNFFRHDRNLQQRVSILGDVTGVFKSPPTLPGSNVSAVSAVAAEADFAAVGHSAKVFRLNCRNVQKQKKVPIPSKKNSGDEIGRKFGPIPVSGKSFDILDGFQN